MAGRSEVSENHNTRSDDAYSASYDDHHSLFLSNDSGDSPRRRVSLVAVPRRLSTDGGDAVGSLDALWGTQSSDSLMAPASRNLSAMLEAIEDTEAPASVSRLIVSENDNALNHRKMGKSLRFALDDASLDV